VTLVLRGDEEIDIDTVRSIIESDKPIESNYVLRVVKL
jgi:hypothetical protein